jgi:alpha-ketoglutaric semialdehyde dehydrogenase
MTLHGFSIIAAQPSRPGGARYRAVNPATGAQLSPDFHSASTEDEDADNAIDAAHEAFPDYRKRPAEDRARFLEAIADEDRGPG